MRVEGERVRENLARFCTLVEVTREGYTNLNWAVTFCTSFVSAHQVVYDTSQILIMSKVLWSK